jgi:hypothetical protein
MVFTNTRPHPIHVGENMAITESLSKIQFGGGLPGGEIWSCNIHFLSALPVDGVPLPACDAVSQWFSRAASLHMGAADLQYLKWNTIDPLTGKYVSQSVTNVAFYGTTLGAGPIVTGTTISADPAASLCVSTKTASLRGRGHLGRFYPPTGQPVDLWNSGDGRVTAAYAQGVATSAAQLITDLNGSHDGSCVVFSKIGQVTMEITGVKVGRVMDHQSRRRNKLAEAYTAASVA